MRSKWIILPGLVALAALGYVAHGAPGQKAAAKSAAGQGAVPADPVVTRKVVVKPMPVRLTAIGTVQPIETVAIKSRIDGEIAQVHIHDGQFVHQGDLLFTLDQKPALVAIRQAQANLDRDQAQLDHARGMVARDAALLKKDFVARQKYDDDTASVAALQATVAGDQAAVASARLTLDYTEIKAPIDGKVGVIGLTQGNLVKANDTISLVTLTQFQPIYVSFHVPEQDLPAVRQAATKAALLVTARPRHATSTTSTGRLSFIDSSVDTSTGTIDLRATFDNHDDALWPGEFVDAAVTLRVQPDALVIPQQAVETGQDGLYVFVVDASNIAHLRPIKVDRTIDNEDVIASGLKAGERVVVEGQLRLGDGAKVVERAAAAHAGGGAS